MPDDVTSPSLATQFADAFSEESNQDAGKAAEAAASKPPATTPPPPAPGQTSLEDDDPNDPLHGLTPEEILKHPRLGPAFQSWSDKAARKQIDSELSKVRADTKAQTEQEIVGAGFDRFVKSLNKTELAQELATDEDGFVDKYTRWKESQGAADQDEVNRAAQVYALTTIVQSTLDLMNGADLSEQAKADLETYRQKLIEDQEGAAGAVKWQTAVQDAVASRKAEKMIEGSADERVNALATERLAQRDAQRPGALASPGRRAAPRPELLKTATRTLFEDAFR